MKRLGFAGCAMLVFLLVVSISAVAGQPTGSVMGWGDQIVVTDLCSRFTAIAGGFRHSLGLKSNGSIVAWGDNGVYYSQCSVPEPNTGYVAVAAGGGHSLALKLGGKIIVWGSNSFGQYYVPEPNTDYTAIAAGEAHNLAIKAGGTIVAWGSNDYGQRDVPSPNTGFKAIAAGSYHSMGLKSDGSIVAWGANWNYQCMVPLPNTGFAAIAAGECHSLGLKKDGSIVAWGSNDAGQRDVPSPNTGFVAVAAGARHSMGLKSDGSIVAWGHNEYGQCDVPSPNTGFIAIAAGPYYSLGLKSDGCVLAWGINDYAQCNVPLPNAGFTAVAASGLHSLALRTDGSVAAWGQNNRGQCDVPYPNTDYTAIATGYDHSLGLKEDGSIAAWGDNYYGQCELPSPNTGFVAIAAGFYHSLGVKENGSVVAWGRNEYGECNVPSPNSGFVAVAASGDHSLGVKEDGSIVAWGQNNFGQCNPPSPNTGFKAVAAGTYFSLALKEDGRIVAWGRNHYGQCKVPAPNEGFTAIGARWYHSLGLKEDGTIVGWGWNDRGWCDVPSPNSGFVAIAVGDYHNLALRDLEPPEPPTALVATAASASSVQLSWQAAKDNVAVTGYKVYRRGAEVGASSTTSYMDTGLQSSTTYSYTVSAYDWMGNESQPSSPPVVVTTLPDTEPPTVPQNVQASARSITSILVSWTASTDNVGVTHYRVFRNGSFVGTNNWPNYIDTGLESGATYSYTATACDAVGHESAHSAPPAVATTPSVPDFCSVDLGTTDINNYLSRVPFTDGGTGAVTIGGLNCRQPSNTSNQYFYFAIDDTYIYDGSVDTAYLEVCYYDDLSGQAFIEPQYDSNSGAYTSLPQVALTGTGKWKTASWTLTDCLFANRQNGGADFRLYVGPNSVKIDSVRISKSPFSGHASVERDLGVNEIYGGLSHPQHSDGNTIVSLKDGVYAKKPTVAGNNYFYFNVSDAVIHDGSSPTVYLKVGYYDSPDGLITPEYDSASGAYTAAETLLFTGTNAWRERVWTLTDVKFANSQNSSSDFRLYVGTAQNVFIDKVMISKVPFPDEEPPTVPANVQAVGLSPSVIRVTWNRSADNFGVAGYRVFRDGAELADVQIEEYVDTGLASGTSYSYSVMAYDAAENASELSPEAIGTTMTGVGIAAAKELPDLTSVGFESHVVTAVFSDYFYIGNIERNAGIRVTPLDMPSDLTVGDVVDVGGVLRTVSGERRVTEAVVTFSIK